MRLLVLALGPLVLTGAVAGCSSGSGSGAVASWCQVDDPAFVENQRTQRKLTNDRIGDIDCPAPAPASNLPDELVLPMPCDRRMVFRAVRIARSDVLDGERAIFGDAAAPDPMAKAITGTWFGEVSGTFSKQPDGGGDATYYIAKYELTAPQFAVFALPGETDFSGGSPACERVAEALKRVNGTAVLPATGLSWADAVGFADRYSRWLIEQEKNGKGLGSILPALESRPGYIRLPTENEWEFAARGGDETGSGGRGYELPKAMGGVVAQELSQIAWFADVGSNPPKDGSTYPVGRKRPNRLMTYDMVGNAEEMTADLFRPVRPDGTLIGRPGGIAVRGGNALDNADQVGVGARRELDSYSVDGKSGSPTVGVRFAIGAPFFSNKRAADGDEMQGNPALRDGIVAAWTRRQTAIAGTTERSAALAVLQRLIGEAAGNSSTGDLETVKREIELAAAKVGEAEARATEDLLLGTLMAAGYALERHNKVLSLESAVAEFQVRTLDPAERASLDRTIAMLPDNRRERSATLDYYSVGVIDLARRSPEQINGAAAVVKSKIERAGLTRLSRLLPRLIQHVGQARSNLDEGTRRAWAQAILGGQ